MNTLVISEIQHFLFENEQGILNLLQKVTSMLVIDVGDGLGHFGHPHPLSFHIKRFYQQRQHHYVTNITVFASKIWWQWCWWHHYVGDFMMVTDWRCWWQNHYVGDFFRYVGDFLNELNRSPISWIGHQHLKLVTNTFGLQHPSPTSM